MENGRKRGRTRADDTLVGREHEMAVLNAALDDVAEGRGSIVMLAGEPGIGKTRLCEEIAAVAQQSGLLTLWGRSYEARGAPPYWPWAQAIRSYVRSVDATRLKREMRSGASVIAEVVSDVREAIPGLSSPPPLEDPESARFRLFDSIASFLKTASQSQPLLIVLDDLHWSDRPTLLLLEYVARELSASRIMLVGAYRDVELNRRHPLAMTLGELARERLSERVLLAGLGEADIGRFIELTLGMRPPEALIRAVYAQTEGNPLFVVEIIRDLLQSGELTAGRAMSRSSWPARVPEGVRDVISRRLGRLSDDCVEVLTEAAVMGRQFRFPVLLKLMSDAGESTLLDLLDEAVAARVIDELPSEAGLYQFTHSLIQETLRSEVSRNRAVRIHARIARVLEEHYVKEAEGHAAELAEHFAEAEPVLGSAPLIKYARAAGDQALKNYAYDDARRHFERALQSLGPGPMSQEQALVLLGLGQAQAGALGRADRYRAVETLIRALSYFLEHGDTENATRALLTDIVPVDGGADHGGTDIVRLMELGIDLVPEGKADRARALLKYAYAIFVETQDIPKTESTYERAWRLIEQLDHEPLFLRAMETRFGIDVQKHHGFPRSDDGIEEAIDRAEQLSEKYIELRLRYHRARWCWQIAASDEIVRASETFLDAALPVGNMNNLENAYVYSAVARALRGDWALAEQHYEEYRKRLPGRATFAIFQVLIKCELKDVDGALRLLDGFEFQNQEPPTSTNDLWHAVVGALPHIGVLLGDEHLLEFAKKSAVAQLRRSAPTRMSYWAAISCGFLARTLDDTELARDSLAKLRDVEHPIQSLTFGFSVDRARANALEVLGDAAGACAAYESAETLLRDRAMRPELARTLAEHAELLLRSAPPPGASGNSKPRGEKAVALAEEGRATARELGMRSLEERLLKILGGRRSGGLANDGGLTPRQVEVLRLIAAGHSNEEIAQRLVVSVHTVANHVRSILDKTGSSNRTGAAAYAIRHGLTAD